MSIRNLVNTTNKGDNDDQGLDEDVIKQFKLIIAIVFIILILFLLYFVYNLIKCYLPKWRRGKVQEDQLQSAKIITEPKKEEGPVTELF